MSEEYRQRKEENCIAYIDITKTTRVYIIKLRDLHKVGISLIDLIVSIKEIAQIKDISNVDLNKNK